jgi:rhodanese-related sulfurtransferase
MRISKGVLIGFFLLGSGLFGYDKTTLIGQNLTTRLDKLKTQTQFIEPIELKELLDKKTDLIILDVREEVETKQEGSIKTDNYINIPRGLLEFNIEENIEDINRKIVVVCYSELRSLLAAHNIKLLGYTSVYVLKGGMEKWKKDCFPQENFTHLFFQGQKPKTGCGSVNEMSMDVFTKQK